MLGRFKIHSPVIDGDPPLPRKNRKSSNVFVTGEFTPKFKSELDGPRGHRVENISVDDVE